MIETNLTFESFQKPIDFRVYIKNEISTVYT